MQNLLSSGRGSLTLEAAIVFPVFLGLMLVLINIIKISMVYVSMDHACGEAVKQIAAHSYPLKYLKAAGAGEVQGLFKLPTAGRVSPEVAKAEQLFAENLGPDDAYSEMPTPVGDAGRALLGEFLQEVVEQAKGQVTETVLKPLVTKYARERIKEFYPLKVLDDGDFEISQIEIYNPNNTSGTNGSVHGQPLNHEDIALVVNYSVKPTVPFFFDFQINLTNTAVERAWTDD